MKNLLKTKESIFKLEELVYNSSYFISDDFLKIYTLSNSFDEELDMISKIIDQELEEENLSIKNPPYYKEREFNNNQIKQLIIPYLEDIYNCLKDNFVEQTYYIKGIKQLINNLKVGF